MSKINLDDRKYLKSKEVEDIFGIKAATLRRQRWGDYGLPYIKLNNQVFYEVEAIENNIKKITPTNKKNEGDRNET